MITGQTIDDRQNIIPGKAHGQAGFHFRTKDHRKQCKDPGQVSQVIPAGPVVFVGTAGAWQVWPVGKGRLVKTSLVMWASEISHLTGEEVGGRRREKVSGDRYKERTR